MRPMMMALLLLSAPCPCLAAAPTGTQSLSGKVAPVHAPVPTTLGGPVKSDDAKHNLVPVGTGMHRR